MPLNYLIAPILVTIVRLVVFSALHSFILHRTFNLKLKALLLYVAPEIITGCLLWAVFLPINIEISKTCALISFSFLAFRAFTSSKYLSHIEKEEDEFRVYYFNNFLQLKSILVTEEEINNAQEGNTINITNNEMEYSFYVLDKNMARHTSGGLRSLADLKS